MSEGGLQQSAIGQRESQSSLGDVLMGSEKILDETRTRKLEGVTAGEISKTKES
jgi:hypothetical protein